MYEELASVKEIVDLTPDEALDRVRAFLVLQGYRPVRRTNTRLIVDRFRPNRISGGEALVLSVTAFPQTGGGVRIAVEGNDDERLQEQRDKWIEWAESLPKKESSGKSPADPVGAAEAVDKPKLEDREKELRMDEDYYFAKEVARRLGKSIPEVWQMADTGELETKMVSGHRVFLKRAVKI